MDVEMKVFVHYMDDGSRGAGEQKAKNDKIHIFHSTSAAKKFLKAVKAGSPYIINPRVENVWYEFDIIDHGE